MFKTKIEDMKKIYNSPVMDVIELKNQQSLLAGSVLGIDSNATFSDEGNVGASELDTPVFGDEDLTFFE